MQLYGSVTMNSSMPRMLDAVEESGFITQTGYHGSNVQSIALTDLEGTWSPGSGA